MSNIRVVIDDQVAMDSDPGQWNNDPPDLESLQLRGGGAKPRPWMQAIMFTITEAAIKAVAGQHVDGTTITVTTSTDGWDISVRG